MGPEAIVQRSRVLGIALRLAGDRIQCLPKSLASQDFVERLREHKPQMMDYQSQQAELQVPLDDSKLRAWAWELADQDLMLPQTVSFVDEPSRPITMAEVSKCARRHLSFIADARIQQRIAGMGRFLLGGWKERQQAAFGALAALYEAMHTEAGQG